MLADLHIHSTASDGRLTPKEIVNQASKAGLSLIAITDHDTIEAHRILANSSIPDRLQIITGVEFSTDLPDVEVHILGYQIDIDNPILLEQLNLMENDRLHRVHKILKKLDALGFTLEYDRVLKIAGAAKSIGRPHVAKALVERGYFPSVSDVFNQLLYKNGPAYVPHYKLTPLQVIEIVHQCGGKAVIAHPGLVGNDAVVQNIIEAGIDGIEVYHPKHSQEAVDKYLALAKKNGLAITGGSDFHGIPGRYPEELGLFTIPTTLANSLNG